MARPPRIPVWLAPDRSVIYFVTICELKRRALWDNETFFSAFKSAIQMLADQRLWQVWSAVVMPDHFHLLVSPLRSRDDRVGNLSGALKRWINECTAQNRTWEFQNGSFDRLLRGNESAEQKWVYIRNNPVRAGLVDQWEQWPWRCGTLEQTE